MDMGARIVHVDVHNACKYAVFSLELIWLQKFEILDSYKCRLNAEMKSK